MTEMAGSLSGIALLKTLVLLLRVILFFSISLTPTCTVGLSQEAHLTKETRVPISSKDAGVLGKIGPAESEYKIGSEPPWEDHEMLWIRFQIRDKIDDLLKRDKPITEETWAYLKKIAAGVLSKQGRLDLIEMVHAAQKQYQSTTRKGFLSRWIDHILDALRAIRDRFWKGTATRLRQLRKYPPQNHLNWEQKVAVLQLSALKEYGLPLYKHEVTLIKEMEKPHFQPTLFDTYVINHLYASKITEIQQSRLMALKYAFLTMLCFEGVHELDRSKYLMEMDSIVDTIHQRRPLSKNQVYFVTAQTRLIDRKGKFRSLFKDPNINWNLPQVNHVKHLQDQLNSEDFAAKGLKMLKKLRISFESGIVGDRKSEEFQKYSRAMRNLEDTYKNDKGWSKDQVNFVIAMDQLRGHPRPLQIMMKDPDINWENLLKSQ